MKRYKAIQRHMRCLSDEAYVTPPPPALMTLNRKERTHGEAYL